MFDELIRVRYPGCYRKLNERIFEPFGNRRNRSRAKNRIDERMHLPDEKKGSLFEPVELREIKSLLILMVGELYCSPSLKLWLTRLMDTRFAQDYSQPCN